MPDSLTLFTQVSGSILLESGVWIVISLLVGGLVHEFLPSSRFKNHLNRPGPTAMLGAVSLGAVLPICSCGVIPLAISLYRSGVRLGPVMAFAVATPIINPAAVILSFALLGPHISLAYIVLGLVLPLLVGTLCDRWGTPFAPTPTVDTTDCCSTQATTAGCCEAEAVLPLQAPGQRLRQGLSWGLFTLGPAIGFYLAIGIVLAGLLNSLVPQSWMEQYLGGQALVGLLAAAVFGASIYVCAVAHIPLVASLLAAGAGPGAAIVFLVTGTATNLPELIALYKTIGRRTVLIYIIALVLASLLAGFLVNLWLLPDFEPAFDPVKSLELVTQGERLWWVPSLWLKTTAAWVVGLLALSGIWQRVQRLLASRRPADSCCSGE